MKKILLMRHSIPEKIKLPTELIPLSEDGINKIEAAKNTVYAYNIDRCYSSSYLRALQTAKGFFANVTVISDLHERVIGEAVQEDFWRKQYANYDFKLKYGESLNDVKKRMKVAIDLILHDMNEGETSLVVSHATAMCSYLLNYATLEVTDTECKLRRIKYENEIILDGRVENVGFFILEFNKNDLENVSYRKM